MSESFPSSHIELVGFDPQDERRREALLALGNGVLSCRASAPEASATRPLPADYPGTYYPGLYRAGWYDLAPREVNGRTTHLEALVNLPNPMGLSFALPGSSWFSLESAEISHYRQRLNLPQGQLERDVSLILGGHQVVLHEERFVSMATPFLIVMQWTLEFPDHVPTVRLRTVLDGGVVNGLVERNRAYEGRRLRDLHHRATPEGDTAVLGHLTKAEHRVVVASRTLVHGQIAKWQTRCEGERLIQETSCRHSGESRLVVEKRILVQVDGQLPVEPDSALREVAAAVPRTGYARLQAAHRDAWQQLWDRIALRAADPELERLLKFNLFHVLQTLSPHSANRDLGFPPRGWQEGYFGQVFWDEIFASSFLSTHFQELTRTLVRYRHRRLDVAQRRARDVGLRGAMFPWRSAYRGEEETPPFQCNPLSGRWFTDHTHLQRHVGAAIAYDVWQLYLATGDQTLLAGEGGELILEIARFWSSLARHDATLDRYVICGVIGPDEYHNIYPGADQPGLDNNAYTNLMAVWTLCRALELLAALPAGQAKALRQRLGIDEAELVQWDVISRRMYLPLIDGRVLDQFEGHADLLPTPPGWQSGPHPRVDWMLEAHDDSSDRYQLTKQADVLMLLYLFPPAELLALFNRLGYPLDSAAIRDTATYHLNHITHESSLSKVVCAGALAHIDSAESWRYFTDSLRTDLDAPADSGTLEGVHLGAMAGTQDVLQRHYLGIRPGRDGLHLSPAIPPALSDVSLALEYRGVRVDAALVGQCLCLTVDPSAKSGIDIVYSAGRRLLPPGETLEIDCRPSATPA